MMHVYVAGPFRAPSAWGIECNIRRAEETSLLIAQWGGVPVIPHTMYRFFQGALPDVFWLDATMSLLLRCDAIAMMRGWEASGGSTGEHDRALDEKILTFYLEHQEKELREWLSQRR